ncbi:MAG: tRNA epoxyqueuosine(34) reductase QueG [Clostridiaceae bacterium]
MKKDHRRKILDYCNSLGLELAGFIECRVFDELKDFYISRKSSSLENEFEEKDINKRINPKYYYEKGKTIISIAFPYLHAYEYSDNGFSVYTRGLDYHNVVTGYMEKICSFINSLGGETHYFVDSNALPERYIAYLAGIGFIGKNNMLITEKYGSFVFLGEIITDLEIECSEERSFEDMNKFTECGECNICYTECPTKAIKKDKKNPNICLSYITQKKQIEDKWFNLLDGRVFGCDSCQKLCPYNLKAEKSTIPEFYPLDFMNLNHGDEILEIENRQFKETLKKTSCGWRGKNVLIRNLLIRKYTKNGKVFHGSRFNSTYIKGYLDRLYSKSNL